MRALRPLLPLCLLALAFAASPATAAADCSQSLAATDHSADVRCALTDLAGAPVASCSVTTTYDPNAGPAFVDARCSAPAGTFCVQLMAPEEGGGRWLYLTWFTNPAC